MLRRRPQKFAPYICDVGAFLQQAHDSGKRIVLEAQLGAMRDIDYGIFPFTSSSNTLAAYAPLGAGIPNCKPGPCGGRAESLLHLRGCRPLCG